MNLHARIDRYKERGFQQLEAEILVLIEESAAALFTSFPDHFILIGVAKGTDVTNESEKPIKFGRSASFVCARIPAAPASKT